MTPRRTTHLRSKEQGDKRMFVKQGVAEDVYASALQRLSDMVKARLPEPQYPVAVRSRPSVARLDTNAINSHRFTFCPWYALIDGRWLVKPFKGMNEGPTSLLDVSQ
jgi:hypothetical protein